MYSYETNGRGNTSATDAKLLERKSQFINLPAVTSEDDGTVLGVADGKWQPVPDDGSGWPSDLPKPSAGGYGYTEGETVHKIDEKYLPVIPAAPSDDETYTLTCTVTNGVPVYSWESAT